MQKYRYSISMLINQDIRETNRKFLDYQEKFLSYYRQDSAKDLPARRYVRRWKVGTVYFKQ